MSKLFSPLCAIFVVASLTTVVKAQTWGGLYDMNQILRQPHPFELTVSNKPNALPLKVPLLSVNHALHRPKKKTGKFPLEDKKRDIKIGPNWSNIFSEIRVGILLHDYGPFSSNEEEGLDANVEILLLAPEALSFISSPRPHFGVSYNSAGDTSAAYGGLYWEWSFWNDWFAGLSFGGMVHDGHLVGDKDDKLRKSLGCRALFREAVNFGYRLSKHHSVMLHLDHSSNASLCEKNTRDGTAEGRHDVILNEGLESVGIRYGFIF